MGTGWAKELTTPLAPRQGVTTPAGRCENQTPPAVGGGWVVIEKRIIGKYPKFTVPLMDPILLATRCGSEPAHEMVVQVV